MKINISVFKKYAVYALEAIGVVALLFAFSLFFGGTSSSQPASSSNYSYSGGTSFDGALSAIPNAKAPSKSTPMTEESYSAGDDSDTPSRSVERKIVKNGNLSLLVIKTEEATEKIKVLAGDFGGFVDAVSVYNASETSKAGTITIRVPADKFDEAVRQLKELAIKVDREEIGATDVTAEFVDLSAQLKNLKAEEQQYLRVMNQAVKVEDILNVSRSLSKVRGSIERLQASINHLSQQIDMSTITILLTEEGDVEIFGIHWRPLFAVKQAFRNMLTGLSGYVDSMIGLIFALPTIILWVATFVAGLWVARKVFRFVKAKFFAKS